ncbi:MAG: sulfotransferase, partial [Pseudomonadota bacterium]
MSDAAAFSRAYSAADRTIHKIATGQPDLQRSLARLEERLWRRELAGIEPGPPIFITSLPRAGTTLLLEVLAAHPDLTSHTYRHMPFLMCPLLWDRLSRGFRQREAKRERAHGDGMAVGYDSVEAFEEILWMAFFPDRFQKDRIRPWTERTKSLGLPEFLTRHMAKMVLLSGGASRYVSKNNANIARIGWLSRALPEAAIVVPFREPSGHIRSMLRQHRGFAEAQKDAPFVREYMESIGHFEFGEAHRPIDFGGWLEGAAELSPETEAYWARYWVAAMENVLAEAEGR